MRYFAKIISNTNPIVAQVIVADQQFIDNLSGIWIETFNDNNSARKNYAGISDTYDVSRDAFIAPKPYPSWIIDEQTYLWKAPIAMPDNTNADEYFWNESTTSWIRRT